MAKKSAYNSRVIARSYAAYLRHREAWAEKGFGLDRELTLSEYSEAHIDFVHKYGNNHVARKIAQDDRTFGAQEASAISRKIAQDVRTRATIVRGDRDRLKELKAQLKELQSQEPEKSIKRRQRKLQQRIEEQTEQLNEDRAILDERKALRKKYAKSKDIYGLQLTEGEIQATESRRRQELVGRGIDPEFPVQASARGQLFQDLLDAGMTFREARAIYDK